MALKQSEKKLLKILGGVVVIAAIVLYRIFNPPQPGPVENTTADTSVVTETAGTESTSSTNGKTSGSRSGVSGGGSAPARNTPSGVSLADFQNHNSPDDCWVAIGDNAYDVSNYIANAGTSASAIVQYCGTLGFEVGFASENSVTIDSIKKKAQNLGPLK